MAQDLFGTLSAGYAGRPEAPCLLTGTGERWSWAQVMARSGAYAQALIAAGARPGDRVAAQVDKSVEVIFLYLGCVRAGCVYLPLNTAYTLAELGYFLGDAEPAVVVCAPAVADSLRAVAGKATVLTLDEQGRGSMRSAADASSGEFTTVPRTAEDLVAILYTSGTTGRSKGAMLMHRNLASNAVTLRDYWRFTSADTLLHALPIYHTHGLFTATNTLLAAGGQILLLPKFDPNEVFRLLPGTTSMMGVPTFYTRLLADPRLTWEAVAHMRLFISGSAPLLAETHASFRERAGHAILERYGMTETSMNSSNPYEGERRAGTVGFPLPGTEIRITEPGTGRPLPAGEIGMIEVKGPNVFKGYWRNLQKTAEELRADGFFITGDLGTFDERGYLSIVGRGKDLVISGGLNVYPKEVESEIDLLPGVVESAVIGIAHPDLGEGVTAVVVARPDAGLTEPAVIAALRQKLAAYKLPKRVIFVPDLPRNTMAKVQKNVLRETYKGLYQG